MFSSGKQKVLLLSSDILSICSVVINLTNLLSSGSTTNVQKCDLTRDIQGRRSNLKVGGLF